MMRVPPSEARAKREEWLRRDVESIYQQLTEGLARPLRLTDLVYAAADRYPGLVPTRADIDAECQLPQKEKVGLEIDQGIFLAHLLAHPRCGAHLVHAMSQPKPQALAALAEFRRSGALDLGPVRVDRRGHVGHVTLQNHAFLNAEDGAWAAALETAVDLVLLDDAIEIGILRGAPATHPKYAERRVFSAGVNLTHLYWGKISLLDYMLDKELGAIAKMYRGHGLGAFDQVEMEVRREKPWIAAVESFAIGGGCQLLLVVDHIVAETGSYFSLPARYEGIIPGVANLRLPRFIGERLTREAILFNTRLIAESEAGRRIADVVVPAARMDETIEQSAAELLAAGPASLIANRRAQRIGAEPLDVFRRYMASYAREQALCMYSDALIDNLERNWRARQRTP
jgi:(3,5-dihydroxyphenyl)acetyl-CoA 1,2-dioxygenase